MAIQNALNLTTTGVVAADGSGVFTGRTITAGSGITVTNGNGTGGNPTIAVTGGGLTWTDATSTSYSLVAGNGYVADNSSLVTFTLPSTATIGDTFVICGFGTGKYTIAQNASQLIHFGAGVTTSGTGGSAAADNRFCNITLVCIQTNTTFAAISATYSWNLT